MNDKLEKAIEELKSYIEIWELEQADSDLRVIIYKKTIESMELAIQALEIQQDLKVYLEWLRGFEKWETIAFYEVADRIEDFILD